MKNIKKAASIAVLCIAIALSCNGGAVTEYSLGEYLNSLKDEAVNTFHQKMAETKVTIDGTGNTVISNGNFSLNVTETYDKVSNATQEGVNLFKGNDTFNEVSKMGIDLFKGNDTQKNMAAKVSQNTTLPTKEEVKTASKKIIGSYKPIVL